MTTHVFLFHLHLGSTAIESITEEFVRQQGDISELQAFLQLPQHKPLRAQLDEAGELMDGKCEIICKMYVVCLDVLLKAFAAFSNTWMQQDVSFVCIFSHCILLFLHPLFQC